MLEIYIARHGQDQDNALGILNGHRNKPLTKKGLVEARALRDYIGKTGITFDKIYSSALLRAYITAIIINELFTLNYPSVLDLLIERDHGIMAGKPISMIEELCAPDIIKNGGYTYFLNPKGGETYPQVLERGQAVIELIKKNHSDGTILLVTSGEIGKMIFAAYHNIGWMEALKMFDFKNSDLILLAENTKPENALIFTHR